MAPLILPFPNFDPVLIQLGPFAIRWYALAYIAGILLGWLYSRALIQKERLWGGPAPLTVLDFDDFVLWVTLGIILGGRTGYVLFYNPQHFLHRLEILAVHHVEIAQDALGLMFEQGIELAPDALRHTGGVVHQAGHLVENPVLRLGHGWLRPVIGNEESYRKKNGDPMGAPQGDTHAASG